MHFKLDYVNADGDISNYYPDFLVKLPDKRVVIVETKGQEDLDVPLKMAAACASGARTSTGFSREPSGTMFVWTRRALRSTSRRRWQS